MTTRLLPPEEWPRLEATDQIQGLWKLLPPTSKVIVVEEAGQIVGCHVLLPVWHLEGLWIAPDHRGRISVARRLWKGVQDVMAGMSIFRVVTAANSDQVKRLLAHVRAEPLPEHFVIPMKVSPTCQ